ncbi:MAG TPA: hypothetical protein VMV33_16465 [Rhodocyclaceae bacterium]|nr:hypothetical protein [Rhodocyclaceae bacterium]
MNRTRSALLALLVATGSVLAMPAWADRGGDRFHGDRGWHGGYRGYHGDRDDDHFGWGLGVLFGSALLWSALQPRSAYYAQPAYPGPSFVTPYYDTPTVVLPPPPAADGWSEPLAPDGRWWYHCAKPEGYYPYVKRCLVGWEKLSPTPPGQ